MNKGKVGKQESNRSKLVVLPYVEGLSERIAKIYKKHEITTSMKPNMIAPSDKLRYTQRTKLKN